MAMADVLGIAASVERIKNDNYASELAWAHGDKQQELRMAESIRGELTLLAGLVEIALERNAERIAVLNG